MLYWLMIDEMQTWVMILGDDESDDKVDDKFDDKW
jgi:hypothetical protein